MRAVTFNRFGGPEVLEIAEFPDPHPGPDQVRVRVRAVGINPSDCRQRAGQMGGQLPQMTGREVAGIVDECGEAVAGVQVGARVFGFSADGAGAAELAVLTHWAPIPRTLDFADAASLPVVVETATRALDVLGVRSGMSLLVNGAAGGVGSAAVQLGVARGARVIGTASLPNHEYLRSLGAEPVTYGEGLVERVRALSPAGVDVALDVAGTGALPALIQLAGGATHVVTLSDFAGAREYRVKFSTGDADGRALHAIDGIGELIESGRFSLQAIRTFPLSEISEAHRACEGGHTRGKLVAVVP